MTIQTGRMPNKETDMTDTTVTIQLQISHDVDVIELITESYPDITIGAENPGFDTDLTGPESDIISLLRDYYYYDDELMYTNHPQLVRPEST
jgi:hypothetical protein